MDPMSIFPPFRLWCELAKDHPPRIWASMLALLLFAGEFHLFGWPVQLAAIPAVAAMVLGPFLDAWLIWQRDFAVEKWDVVVLADEEEI